MRAIVALPKSGSQWFAECLFGLHRTPGRIFSPETKPRAIARILEMTFGYPTSNSTPICRPCSSFPQTLEDVFAAMRERRLVRDTQEIFAFCKARFLAQKFAAVGLIRHRAFTFPGSGNVKTWYTKIADSFVDNRQHYQPKIQQLIQRAIIEIPRNVRWLGGHFVATYVLKDAEGPRLPVLSWIDLIGTARKSLEDLLAHVLPIASERTAVISRIVETRFSVAKLHELRREYLCLDVDQHLWPVLREFQLEGNRNFINPADIRLSDLQVP